MIDHFLPQIDESPLRKKEKRPFSAAELRLPKLLMICKPISGKENSMSVVDYFLVASLLCIGVFTVLQRRSLLGRIEELESQLRKSARAANAVQEILEKGKRSQNLWKSVTDSGSDLWKTA